MTNFKYTVHSAKINHFCPELHLENDVKRPTESRVYNTRVTFSVMLDTHCLDQWEQHAKETNVGAPTHLPAQVSILHNKK